MCNNCKDYNIEISPKENITDNIQANDSTVNENDISSTKESKRFRNNNLFDNNNDLLNVNNIRRKHYNEDTTTPKNLKQRKRKINNLDINLNLNQPNRRTLLTFENSETHYKRKKIKIGDNFNMDMDEYYDKIENKVNEDDVEYERNELKKIWSNDQNPLSEKKIEEFLNVSRMFWNYNNLNIENELCSDFFNDLEEFIKDKKLNLMNKRKNINFKIESLKLFLKKGINLSTHCDEISLKILHICNYKVKVALLFLLKGFNPFIEGKFF